MSWFAFSTVARFAVDAAVNCTMRPAAGTAFEFQFAVVTHEVLLEPSHDGP